jgi:hypothetical protein
MYLMFSSLKSSMVDLWRIIMPQVDAGKKMRFIWRLRLRKCQPKKAGTARLPAETRSGSGRAGKGYLEKLPLRRSWHHRETKNIHRGELRKNFSHLQNGFDQ